MIPILASTAALLAGGFFLVVSNGLSGTLVPLRGMLEGFSPFSIGIIGAAQFIGFIFGCLIGPFVVKRAGHIRAFAVLAGIMSCTYLAFPLTVSEVTWAVFRCFNGFCAAGMFMILESWINERATNETRGQVFSLYQAILLMAALGGQAMLALAPIESYKLFSLAAIVAMLALIPVSLTASRAPAPLNSVKPRLFWLFKISPIAGVCCTLVGMANGAMWGLAPVFAQNQGLSTAQVGWFMGAIIIGGAITQWPIGRLSDLMDRRWVLLDVSAATAVVGLSFNIFQNLELWLLLFQAAFYGGLSLTLYSLCAAHLNDLVEPEDFVPASTGILLTFGIGAVIGPLIASAMMESIGYSSLFLFTMVIHATIAIYCLYRLTVKRRDMQDDREPFLVSMPRSTPIVSQLDPRTEASNEDANQL